MSKKWEIISENSNESLLNKLLKNRGLETKAQIEEFLNPLNSEFISPNFFSDMGKAVERICFAKNNDEKILIWGDFDADGVTSTSILFKTFEKIGANFTYYIPNRKDDGHGLNSKELIKFISKEKIKLLITVDCGISNVKEIDLLNSFKIDTIITDHHRAENAVPNAFAILNANAPDSISNAATVSDITSLSNLCGAGVAFKLYCALCDKFSDLKEIYDEILCLACVGTISDIVPLLGENRAIVAKGLKLINENKHEGIAFLMNECGKKENITSTDIAFTLTPRINAAGRLSTVDEPFELLTNKDKANFKMLVGKLSNYNIIRQNMCNETFESAKNEIENNNLNKQKAIILLNKDWHIGIIGIVASKVVEEYQKPAFLMTLTDDNQIRCSIRSVEGYNVYEILSHLKDKFLGFGGHEFAGGFSFDSTENSFEAIKAAILKTIDELYPNAPSIALRKIDAELSAFDINEDLINTISMLEPFGEQNPSPVFCMQNVKYFSHKFMGKNSEHLRLEIQKEDVILRCVWWGKSDFEAPKVVFDVAFAPFLNEFNGERTIQLEIVDTSLEQKQNDDKIKLYDHRKKENILNQVNEYLQNACPTCVFAQKIETLKVLENFPNISKNIKNNFENAESLMLFDYPNSLEEFKKIVENIKPNKIHIFRENFDENIDFYIKTLSGMLKFSANKKNGEYDPLKIANLLGLSQKFVDIATQIFAQEKFVALQNGKICYLAPLNFENVHNNVLFDTLIEEFETIMDFKNDLLNLQSEKIKELI